MFSSIYPKRLLNQPVYTPETHSRTELYAYPPSSKLFTCMDVDCLYIQTLLLFTQVPFNFVEHSEPNFSPSGRLPCLSVGENVYTGDDIEQYALEKGLNIDAHLQGNQKSVKVAFASYLMSKLKFALDYELWYDNVHFNSITLKLFGEAYPWPLHYLIPQRERSVRIKELLAQSPVLQPREVDLANQIYNGASQALHDLSILLGDQTYLFGEKPTSLDALAFSYLHIILSLLSLSKGNSELRRLTMGYENLQLYARRIWTGWYANVDSIGSTLNTE